MGGKTNLQSAFRSGQMANRPTAACLAAGWSVKNDKKGKGEKEEAEGGIEGSKTWMDPQRDGMTRDRHWASELERGHRQVKGEHDSC